jgi:nitroreductase
MNILPELKQRKSPLVFQANMVDKHQLHVLIEAARWAPSCFNNQSWHYVFVAKDHGTRSALESALSLGNGWAKKAPYLVAVGADPTQDCQTNKLPYYAYDAGLSVMSLVIEAEHQGLRVHQMAGWNEGQVKRALGFPDHYRVIVLFALGYEADVKNLWDKLTDKVKTKLTKPRERKPYEANFFFQSFQKRK